MQIIQNERNIKTCLAFIKDECSDKNCSNRHMEENELAKEILVYSNSIEEKCITKNNIEMSITLLPMVLDNLQDQNMILLCLKEFLKQCQNRFKILKIEFFSLFEGDKQLYEKVFKKIAKFEKIERLYLQFMGNGQDFSDLSLNPIKTLLDKLKKINSISLVIINGNFTSSDLKNFFIESNSPLMKMKEINLFLNVCICNDLFFFKSLLYSNVTNFSIEISNFIILKEENKQNFAKELFQTISDLKIETFCLKEKMAITYGFKIELQNYDLRIEFSDLIGGNKEVAIPKKYSQIFPFLQCVNMLKELSLELRLRKFEDYCSVMNFLKSIPKKLGYLEKFHLSLNGNNKKNLSKIEKIKKLIEAWFVVKKKFVWILKMKKIVTHFRREILLEIFFEYVFKINFFNY